MGLDIKAYARCRPVEVEFDADGETTQVNTVKAYVNPAFPRQADDIVHDAWYEHGESMRFGAGSYPSYGVWRRELARVGGYEARDAWSGKVVEAPFVELVRFADNEGTIGPETSAKLAADFAAREDAARGRMDDEHFSLYCKWREAFVLASDGGMIEFG